jgi:hypothetical protein
VFKHPVSSRTTAADWISLISLGMTIPCHFSGSKLS